MRKRKQGGFIVSVELLFIITFMILALVIGYSSLNDAVVNELVDTANAIDSLNQSFAYSGATSHSGSHSGASYTDGVDFCQTLDVVGVDGFDRCVALASPAPEVPVP